jgi:hypothetical protein
VANWLSMRIVSLKNNLGSNFLLEYSKIDFIFHGKQDISIKLLLVLMFPKYPAANFVFSWAPKQISQIKQETGEITSKIYFTKLPGRAAKNLGNILLVQTCHHLNSQENSTSHIRMSVICKKKIARHEKSVQSKDPLNVFGFSIPFAL